MVLLYSFQALWKEWGDSNFPIFSQNCQFHHMGLESLNHFNVFFNYISFWALRSIFFDLRDAILFLQGLLFCVYISIIFYKYTLYVSIYHSSSYSITPVHAIPQYKLYHSSTSYTTPVQVIPPSSPESLSYPHLEKLTIKPDIGNTKLIISNTYIPSASSCSNGYQSSI